MRYNKSFVISFISFISFLMLIKFEIENYLKRFPKKSEKETISSWLSYLTTITHLDFT